MPVIFDYMFVCSTAHLFSNPTWNSYSYHIILWCSWILLQIEDIFSLPTLWTPGFMGGCRWRNKTGELLNKQIVGDTGIPFPPNRILKSHMKHLHIYQQDPTDPGFLESFIFWFGSFICFFSAKKDRYNHDAILLPGSRNNITWFSHVSVTRGTHQLSTSGWNSTVSKPSRGSTRCPTKAGATCGKSINICQG